jgi:glutamine amidotransferase
MCRVVAYLGPRVSLNALVEREPHSLYQQSYAAKELETSVVSADGWGAAWYLPDDSRACVYRSTQPIWGDPNRSDLGRTVSSRCILAAVRSATDPLSIAAMNTQPFSFERLSFVHNGYVDAFRRTLRRTVCEDLGDAAYANIAGDTDSEHLFAMIVNAWLALPDDDPELRLVSAARSAVEKLRRLARERSLVLLVTLVVGDGERLVALRASEAGKSPSLYLRRVDAPQAVWLASEPTDFAQAGWEPVPDESGLVASLSGCRRFELS